MKKKILIPIFILMISLVAVVTASWQILNFKENKVPSEYFPYEVNAVQNVIYNGQEHDVTVTLTEGSVVDNNDLIIEYYRYSTSIDKDDVIHNITLLQNEKPKHSGIYIAKIYRMVDVTTEDRGVTQEKEEIYNVRLNINKRQVIVSSYADKFIYFGQDTSGVTFGYDIEQALEGSDRGLVAGDELKESSSFVLDAGYKKYQTYGVCTIAISGLYDVNDNYEIIYNPGEFHVKQLPISFSWDTNSLKTIYSGKYQRPSIGTYSTSVEGVDMEELLQNVNFNAIYDTDTTKLINAGLYDVTCTGFDNPNFIFDESVSTDYKDTAFEIEKCKVNYSWYTDTEQKLIFNGESQHQKAYLTSIVDGIDVEMVVDSFKLLENESNNNERDTTYINYKTSGEIEANVNKNGDKLYADLYTIELLSLSNPNYEFAEGSTSTTYKIYPKELTLAWHEDNSFVFSNKPQIVEADEIGLIDNYPSGLYFDGAETNANYVNEETMIPSYTNSDNELITFNKYYSTARVTSTNYYLAEDNIKNEFKITQLEVFITWGSQVEFVYNGQMNSHCPTASIALETGYPDAGLTILGSAVNANSDHLGNKYNGFDDYMAQAKISNTNYKLLENTTCGFKVKASPLVVGINEDLPDGAVSINSTSRSLSRNTSYADITYEYFGKRFIPTAFYEGTLYGDDTCSVDVKYVKDNGTLSAEGALDVGTYLAKTVGLTNTNYSIVEEKSINVVINPRPIYITWDNLEFSYDSESHLPTVSISNLCDIDIPTNPNADPLVYVRVDNSFAQTNANITYTGGNLIAGFNRYPVSLTSNNITNEAGEVVKNYLVYGSRGHNYICSTESLCENTFTIRQAQLTINALKNEITYGDVPSLSKTSHIELVGLKPNDTIDSLTNLTYDINYKQYYDVTNALKNVSYEASWTGVTNTNYEITYNSAEFVVNRKPVTISWDTVTTHVYSSSLWAPAANIIGLVNDDKVSVEIAGKQKDTNVKTGLTYNASIGNLISDDSLDQADNYIISNPDTTQQFTITQKPVTINWTKINLSYTSGLQFAEYEFVGVLNNEDLLETISGKQTDANKNSKGVFGSAYTASITEIGNLNYMFASNADTEEEFYINALGITVNWITPEFSYKGITQLPTISSLSTIYDSDINSVSTNITASSESTVAGFIAGIWAGSHKATAQLTGAKASNYEIINNETFDYNISKAPLEVILNGNTIIYGDAPVDNGYTVKGFENGETVAVLGNSISYTYSYSRYGNIGYYDINASGFTSNNYEITYTKATLTVEARKVEIRFTDLDSYVYKKGAYSPIATVTNLARETDVCRVELTEFINVGEHTSTVVSISNSNYTIVGTNYSHTFTITPKPITINWNGYEGLIYNNKVQELSVGSNDIISGDTVNYTISYTTGGKNAGSHTAKVAIDNNNYTIAVNETTTYTIAKKDINVNWSSDKVIYCNSEVMPEVEVTGFIDGDSSVTVTYNNKGTNVGNYTVNVVLSDDTNYYIATGASCDYEITPKTITINWSDVDYTYRKDYIAPIPTVDGLIDGDTSASITFTYSGDNLVDGKAIYVGNYIAMASVVGQHPANYTIVSGASKDFTITPQEITIKWGELSFDYTGELITPTATAEGLFEGDTCTLTVSGAASEAGTHTVTVTGISNTNYKLPSNSSTTFEIIQTIPTTTLTVTIYGNVTIKYGDDLVLEYTTQAPTGTQSKVYYTISGFRDGDSIDLLGEQLLSLTTNYIKGNNVGTYTITGASGFTLENYEIEYVIVDGEITVNPKEITIEWTQTSFEYDGKPHLPTYTLNGVIGNECDIKFVDDKGNDFAAPTDYRQYMVYISLTNDNGNYIIGGNDFVLLDITQREVGIKWNISGLVYTGSPIIVATLTNSVDDDNVTLVFNKEVKDAGTYTVTITGLQGTNKSNYKLPTENLSKTFIVDKVTPEVTTLPKLPAIFEGQSLTNSQISGGAATLNGTTVPGRFEFYNVNWNSIKFTSSGSSTKVDQTQTIEVKFIPANGVNYAEVVVDVTIPINAVASLGYNGTYYGSVEAAVTAANSKGSGYVYVLPQDSYIPSIKSDLTINSGVTLILPCKDGAIDATTYFMNGSAQNVVYSKLYIPYGVTLIVNGKLNITAEVDPGGNPNSAIVLARGVLMNDGKIIASGGTINAYGYIKGNVRENDTTGNGSIELINSTLNDVFRIFNWPGGNNALALSNEKVVPFTAYSYHNVSCTLKINAGSTYSSTAIVEVAQMEILGQTIGGPSAKTVTLVGNGGLFELKNGYIFKTVEDLTNIGVNSSYISTNQSMALRGVFEVYGDVDDNSIHIEEKVMNIAGIDITTGPDCPMPIGMMKVNIMSGTTLIDTNSYKFLPGSELYINDGAILNIASNVSIIFYDEYKEEYPYTQGDSSVPAGNSIGYYSKITEWIRLKGETDEFGAQFKVAGKLLCYGGVAGIIKGEGSGTIIISNTEPEIRELTSLTYGSTLNSSASTDKFTYTAEGYLNGNTSELEKFNNNVTYYYNSVTNTWGTPIKINYVTNYSGLSISSDTVFNGSAGYIIPDSKLFSISRNGYTLQWYTDSSLTTLYDTLNGIKPPKDVTEITLYAKWIPNEYNVSFDSQGGTNVDCITVTYTQSYGTLPIPTKPGYVFTGWTLDGNSITEVDVVNKFEDHTLVATWEAATYTVTFDSNGGSSVDSKIVTYNTAYGTLPTPTLDGFLFKGWKLGDVSITDRTIVTTTSDHVLVAQWEEKTQVYVVTFDCSDYDGTIKEIEYNANSNYGELEALIKDGYTFIGWYSVEDEMMIHSTNIVTKNVTLKPKFTSNTYTIVFDGNGGSGNMNSQIHTYDEELTLSTNTYSKNGYKFAGWLYDGKLYSDMANVKNLTIIADDNITFIAQWTGIEYVVDFNANTGTGGMTQQVHTYGKELALSANLFTKSGYHFVEWNTKADGNGTVYSDEQIVTNLSSTETEVITLYAQWSPNTYIVVFDGNGKELGDIQQMEVVNGVEFQLPENKFSKTGYTFNGWLCTNNNESYIDKALCTLSNFDNNSTVTFVAQWKANKYTVSFNSNGGSSVESKPVTYNTAYGTLPTPTRSNYTFDGWYLNDEKITNTSVVKTASDHTLDAKWSRTCLAEGTLITMANGTRKPVEELQMGEMVLTWDLEIGGYRFVPVLVPVYHGTDETNIINLVFDDGTIVRIIAEHGFFSSTINNWIYINEYNYLDYIGYSFIKESDDIVGNKCETVKLVNSFITTETTGIYSVVAAYTISCYTEGLLSITPPEGAYGLFHYFDIGDEMKYDEEKMKQDIEMYGLYTYEDLELYVTKEEFAALNLQYLKVSVGKGLVTEEQLFAILQKFFPKM